MGYYARPGGVPRSGLVQLIQMQQQSAAQIAELEAQLAELQRGGEPEQDAGGPPPPPAAALCVQLGLLNAGRTQAQATQTDPQAGAGFSTP